MRNFSPKFLKLFSNISYSCFKKAPCSSPSVFDLGARFLTRPKFSSLWKGKD